MHQQFFISSIIATHTAKKAHTSYFLHTSPSKIGGKKFNIINKIVEYAWHNLHMKFLFRSKPGLRSEKFQKKDIQAKKDFRPKKEHI
jgi:hypothetical protein